MKILITGGCGFIGSHVADKFLKEGHKIFIIDNLSTGKKENVKGKHKFYNLNVADRKCEEVFKINKFDIVIHMAAQVDVKTSIEHPYLDSKSNLVGLTNILDLSSRYGVKKFIFASSAAVYGNIESVPILEEFPKNPISPYGMSKSVGEFYCEKWREIYGLETVCFRFSNVYGPRQGLVGESGVISIFMQRLLSRQDMIIFGDGMQTRDFIYVEDLACAIYKSIKYSDCTGIYNLSTNTEKSLKDLTETLNELHPIKKIIYKDKKPGDILQSRLDNSKIKNILDWYPKYSFEEGIKKTYKWYSNNKENFITTEESEKKEKNKRKYKKVMPYIENVLIFLAILMLNIRFTNLENFNYNMMYSIAYIVVIGIAYGQSQAGIATVLSGIIYLSVFMRLEGDLITVIYESIHLIQLALYILIGVITGYSIEKRNNIIYSKDLQLKILDEKYKFLQEMYNETRMVKEELQKQIINNKDSFSQIYNIVSSLGSLDFEEIFIESISIIEKVMKSKMVSIYIVNEKKDFLRLKARSGNNEYRIPNSIRIEENDNIDKIIKKADIYVNRDFDKNMPIIAAPLFNNGKIICYISIHETNFENLTLYHINLYKTLINLISNYLIRAYEYEDAIYYKKYIEDTIIIRKEYFKKIIKSMNKKSKKYNMDYSILNITNKVDNLRMLNDKISSITRNDDYIGLVDGKVNIILNNTNDKNSEIVIERLRKVGIESETISEEYTI